MVLEPQAVGRLRPALNLKRRLVAAFGRPPQSNFGSAFSLGLIERVGRVQQVTRFGGI